jgi:acylphosphatase
LNLQVRTRCRVVADLVLVHPDGRVEVILKGQDEDVVRKTRDAILQAQTRALPGGSVPAPRNSETETSADRHRPGVEAQGHALRRVR